MKSQWTLGEGEENIWKFRREILKEKFSMYILSGVIIKFKVRSHGAVECMGLYVYTCSCCQVLLNNTVKVHQCTCMYFKPWPSFTVYLNQNLNQYSLCCESFFFILIQNIDPPSFFFIYREMLHSIFIPISSLLGRLKVRFVS